MKSSKRQAGILMPVSSLPSAYGIGNIGGSAKRFIDYLSESKVKIWQILPLQPTSYGDSPYQSPSSSALNYYFIDVERLYSDGLIKKSELLTQKDISRRVDYGRLFNDRIKLLRTAFSRFDRQNGAWLAFLKKGEYNDFATFMTFKTAFSYAPWTAWGEYKHYEKKKVNAFLAKNVDEYEFWQFTQYLFSEQWRELKAYAKKKSVLIFGDMPIYVSFDSAEMWIHPELFQTDEEGNPALLAGVPPDAFSEDGQLWGNPVYDWTYMQKNGYAWWKRRIKTALKFYDLLRIDHFRGFDRYYAVKVGSTTAKEGEWLDGPKGELFALLLSAPIVAEDLGVIDDGVRTLMATVGYPGMRVLEFGLDGNGENPHKPSNYPTNCVAYSGTHDNEPFASFIGKEASCSSYSVSVLRSECEKAGVPFDGTSAKTLTESAITLLFSSKADKVIVPMQDLLCMGEDARINAPSTSDGKNWTFRFLRSDFTKSVQTRLQKLISRYNR